MKITKRELSASILLHRSFGEREVNVEEALSLLRREMCLTRSSALNVVKRLRKLGFLEIRKREDSIVVLPYSPLRPLEAMALSHLSSRKERCRTAK
ncbi:MAG: hypothetical protein ABDH61_04380 [Acidilobaceae archaeon]